MKCIFCGNSESKVVDSRYLKDTSIRRRRECLNCGKRFTTYETAETNPMVVTNADNVREPFKTEKLTESIVYATYCTDVENVAEIVEEIEKKLFAIQQQEISTNTLILATGHSARDIFEMLKNHNVKMEKKPFCYKTKKLAFQGFFIS